MQVINKQKIGRCSAGPVNHETEEWVKDVKAKDSLGCSDYETMKFKVLRNISKKNSRIKNNRIIILYFRIINLELPRDLVGRISLQAALESREAQQGCSIFKGNFLYAEDHPLGHEESRVSIAVQR